MAIQKKVCLLGDFAVGKTSLVRRFVEDRFDDKYLSTIGVKVSRKSLQREMGTLNMILWDLAGGEDFLRLTQSYLRGAAAAVLVCDLVRAETVGACLQYAQSLLAVNPEAVFVIAANKMDLAEERQVTDEALVELSEAISAPRFFTSAKNGQNVEDAFACLAEQLDGLND